MTRLQTLKAEVLGLPDRERAILAAELLETLPPVLSDDDEGLAEAMRRDAELDADPSAGMTWEEIKKALGR